MAEYIEREAALKLLNRNSITKHITFADDVSIYDTIKNIPAADAVEVVHSEWIEYQTPNIICCSECDWGTGIDEKSFKYCPNCGAKMDGERKCEDA